ncbi:MAG: FAD-binding protein [Alphaproteobacteria bacterium]|nr:FAD-binding protein [Alphaproteobacteria bacterium]
MPERVIVVGAGIAGLNAAMALGKTGREVIVLDRDPPPADDYSIDDAFYRWDRKGVTQLRHSHVFLGRLYCTIRDRYPDLLDSLKEAGARETMLMDGLSSLLRPQYKPADGDRDLAFLFSRRTTLELVMRRYAQDKAGATFRTGALVHGLEVARKAGRLTVTGVKVRFGETEEIIRGDVIVDATGRTTVMPQWLIEAGAYIPEEESPAGILYFTRHYRLREGVEEPARTDVPTAGDLGYIKYGIFNADNRHFSLTIAVPEIEHELRKVIVRPEIFDKIASLFPGAARWTDAERAEGVSKVFSMGNLKSVWRHYVADNEPTVLNFFAIGDAAVRTNPLYGRGCSIGAVHAHVLAEALEHTKDPMTRARYYAARSREEVRGHWESMMQQDLAAIRRAEAAQNPNYRPSLRARILRSFVEDAIGPATRGDLAVLRAMMRPFHMLEAPDRWLRRPAILARVLWVWMQPKALKKRFYHDNLGPNRERMFAALGIVPTQAPSPEAAA